MIRVSQGNDFTPLSLRASLSKLPSTPTIGKLQGSNQNPTTRASIEIIPNSAPTSLDLISRVREGLQYHTPELCEEGVNETYFLKDKNGKKIAIFKPQDEEANSENNPKRNLEDSSLPKGILPGEAAAREVAAYLLDREHFYGVPRTLMVKIAHTFNKNASSFEKLIIKTGSLQEFIDNDGSSEDFGSSSFPVSEVHKIGIMDLHIFNIDRHAGNILVRKSRNNAISLIPIDHGFSLPDTPECPWFEWMNWSQSRQPFDEDTKSYIQRMDFERDSQLLQHELNVRPECLLHMRFTVALLQKAAALNLTLYDIGTILCRKNPDVPSIYEEIFESANKEIATLNSLSDSEDSDPQTTFSEDFFRFISQSLDQELVKKCFKEPFELARIQRLPDSRLTEILVK